MCLGFLWPLGPLEGKVHDAAGCLDGLHSLEGVRQDCPLALLISGRAYGPAEWILDRRQARHTHRCCQIGDVGQGDGREPGCLYRPLCQSDGPATDRSGRDEDDEVHVFFLKPGNDL